MAPTASWPRWTMPDRALAGCGIAITRPIEQARTLSDLIIGNGGKPIPFPLLDIAPLDDYSAFDQVLAGLPESDWAIFISTNAVQQGMPRVTARYPTLPPKLRFAAIGPATAEELGRHGIDLVLVPSDRYDSESLLTLPEMHDMTHRRVIVFRGVGGRELLADTLRARGAEVVFAECYRRINPQRDTGELPQLWQNGQLHALVVTSSEALRNLLQLAGNAPWLRGTLICVNHPRIGETARANGLRVAIADAPGDEAMLQCLIHHLQDRTKI
ncbi:uroporphyrinogen-III synthase [Methylobacillus sp. MM3]|uniref:uroporphyrinogen-III synthase n=1 Tax=Methylobacillus sp. MM3 TaxID=1848039 RepID=UPI00352E3A7D